MNTVETLMSVHLCQYKLTLSDILPFITADLSNIVKNKFCRTWDSDSSKEFFQSKLERMQNILECCFSIEGSTSNTRFQKSEKHYLDFQLVKHCRFLEWKTVFEDYLNAYVRFGSKMKQYEVVMDRELEFHEKLLLEEINSTRHGVILLIKQ